MRTLDLPVVDRIGGATARPFEPERDYPTVAELIAATNTADGAEYAPTADGLRHDWLLVGVDAARDVVVVELEGRTAGAASIAWRERDGRIVHRLEVFVAQSARRRGIGSALLAWGERRACSTVADGRGGPPDMAHNFSVWADLGVPGVAEFAAAHGYAPVRYFFIMARDLGEPIPELPLPAGLDVRPVAEADHRRIWDADGEAFEDHFEAGVRTEREFEAFFTAPDLDTRLWQVGWDGDEVAGSVINTVYRDENARLGRERGWLDHVSVRRPWRGRGLASALIARSLGVLREHGCREAVLGVDADNPTGALSVYERLGFRRERTAAIFRKEF